MDGIVIGTDEYGFCASTANIWQVVGIVMLIFKIVIPILLIIWGMLDLGKAVIAAKDDEIKKSVKSLAMRAVAAVVVFFIPTIVGLVMGLISDFKNTAKDDWKVCRICITDPHDDECNHLASDAWGN